MPRVKGLALVSLIALALSARPALSQDRSGDPPAPGSNRGADTGTSTNPQDKHSTRPPRPGADGDQRRDLPSGAPSDRRSTSGNGNRMQGPPPNSSHPEHGPNGRATSQAQTSDGNGNFGRRQGPPPGRPPAQTGDGSGRPNQE